MDRNHILGMICGFYLSRFDAEAYVHLGYATQRATHEALGNALAVRAESIKNWRDEFDPIHSNPRQGWRNRAMYPSRNRVLQALGVLEEHELGALVRELLTSPSGAAACAVLAAVEEGEGRAGDDAVARGLRGPTGIAAEQAYLEYHRRYQQPLAGQVVDRRHDECGYDFEIRGNGARIVVEVKGTARGQGGISFTNKEWETAQRLGESYYLALVRDVASDPEIFIIRDPGAQLVARFCTYTTIQVSWFVSDSSMRGTETRPAD